MSMKRHSALSTSHSYQQRRAAIRAAASAAEVPPTYDVAYDPSHPDADWAGLVKKEDLYKKKHFKDHPAHRQVWCDLLSPTTHSLPDEPVQ